MCKHHLLQVKQELVPLSAEYQRNLQASKVSLLEEVAGDVLAESARVVVDLSKLRSQPVQSG
jgi:hypothetical protein